MTSAQAETVSAFPDFQMDDAPEFEADGIPRFDPDEMDVGRIEAELAELPHLTGDRSYQEPLTIERIYRSEGARNAIESLSEIPNPTTAIHTIISGRFALWDYVPAVIQLGGTIESLYLATLGFSRKNMAELSAMLDAGQIGSVSLICSHYFKGTSNGIYEFAAEQLSARGQRFLSIRTHAKIVLIKLADGRTITLESSANLRSCKNIEQVFIAGLPDLHRFHSTWMDELFRA